MVQESAVEKGGKENNTKKVDEAKLQKIKYDNMREQTYLRSRQWCWLWGWFRSGLL